MADLHLVLGAVSKGTYKDVLLALVQTDAFLYMLPAQPPGS
jgi:hypothetical protein